MIVRTRQGEKEFRAFALSDMTRWGYTGLRSTQVNANAVKGIPALHRAARLRAEALANLRLCVWRGEGPERKRVDNVWQARLFRRAANEYQSRFVFWETVAESLAWRGNAYIWKLIDPLDLRVIELWALHPDQVQCKGETYDVTVSDGFLDPVGKGNGKYTNLGPDKILHIRGHGEGGMYEAPSPIEVFRQSLGSALERQRYETRLYKRGTALQLAVEFPQNVTKAQAAEWRQMWRETYEGADGESTAILGGGATLKPIGMTAADAEFVQMSNITVEDAARIMAVPINLLSVPRVENAADLEQDLATWLRFSIGPECERIEAALEGDDQLFADAPPNAASVYPKFDTDMFVRGDLRTEAEILVQLVQAGILLPDEARSLRGLEDLPDGVGKIPQVTPVGGAPNPNAASAPVAAANGNGAGGY